MTQVPGGEVTSVRVGDCNGDQSVRDPSRPRCIVRRRCRRRRTRRCSSAIWRSVSNRQIESRTMTRRKHLPRFDGLAMAAAPGRLLAPVRGLRPRRRSCASRSPRASPTRFPSRSCPSRARCRPTAGSTWRSRAARSRGQRPFHALPRTQMTATPTRARRRGAGGLARERQRLRRRRSRDAARGGQLAVDFDL